MYVCHHCDNPPCVNPDHLFLGTQQENMADMKRKGRSKDNRGIRNPKAKLTSLDVRAIRAIDKTGICTRKSISKAFGVNPSSISAVALGRTWND